MVLGEGEAVLGFGGFSEEVECEVIGWGVGGGGV